VARAGAKGTQAAKIPVLPQDGVKGGDDSSHFMVRHAVIMEIRFPDGTVVMACSLAERRENNPNRDFGLYLDPAWRPTWDAELIDWPDLGIPADPTAAATQIVKAFARARRGDRVEIGCHFGLGRTGTVLACMATLAGVAAKDAVAWVRANYRAEAVETHDQSRWVLWFARRHNRYGE